MKYSDSLMEKKLKELQLISKRTSEINETNKQLEATTDVLKENVESFTQRKKEAEDLIKSLEADVKARENELNKAEFEKEKVSTELSRLRGLKESLEVEVRGLENRLQKLTAEFDKRAAEVNELTDRKAKIEEDIEVGMDNLNDFKNALEMKEAILNKRESVLVNKEKLK